MRYSGRKMAITFSLRVLRDAKLFSPNFQYQHYFKNPVFCFVIKTLLTVLSAC